MEAKKYKYPPETELYSLWRKFCISGSVSTDHRLSGRHAGQLNLISGPDFRGAEFDLDGKRYRGDVEIHRVMSDWFRHGHHLDWRYDNVLLHLVAEGVSSKKLPVTNSKGLDITTLSFQNFPVIKSNMIVPLTCRQSDLEPIDLHRSLKRLSLNRLFERVKLFNRTSMGDGTDQAFYRLLLRIMGRGQNADIFEKMALMLPWQSIQLIKKRYHLDYKGWQEFLLYLGGFNSGHSKLNIPGLSMQPPLSQNMWQFAGQRPKSHPQNRIKGLAGFIHGFNNPSIYQHFVESAALRKPYGDFYKLLNMIFLPDHKELTHLYWGQSLLIEIIGNVVIPALYHDSEVTRSEGYQSYLEDFYFWLPQKITYGCLKGFHSWPEFSPLPKKFYIQQALLWMWRNYCDSEGCHLCPLNRIAESN